MTEELLTSPQPTLQDWMRSHKKAVELGDTEEAEFALSEIKRLNRLAGINDPDAIAAQEAEGVDLGIRDIPEVVKGVGSGVVKTVKGLASVRSSPSAAWDVAKGVGKGLVTGGWDMQQAMQKAQSPREFGEALVAPLATMVGARMTSASAAPTPITQVPQALGRIGSRAIGMAGRGTAAAVKGVVNRTPGIRAIPAIAEEVSTAMRGSEVPKAPVPGLQSIGETVTRTSPGPVGPRTVPTSTLTPSEASTSAWEASGRPQGYRPTSAFPETAPSPLTQTGPHGYRADYVTRPPASTPSMSPEEIAELARLNANAPSLPGTETVRGMAQQSAANVPPAPNVRPLRAPPSDLDAFTAARGSEPIPREVAGLQRIGETVMRAEPSTLPPPRPLQPITQGTYETPEVLPPRPGMAPTPPSVNPFANTPAEEAAQQTQAMKRAGKDPVSQAAREAYQRTQKAGVTPEESEFAARMAAQRVKKGEPNEIPLPPGRGEPTPAQIAARLETEAQQTRSRPRGPGMGRSTGEYAQVPEEILGKAKRMLEQGAGIEEINATLKTQLTLEDLK